MTLLFSSQLANGVLHFLYMLSELLVSIILYLRNISEFLQSQISLRLVP